MHRLSRALVAFIASSAIVLSITACEPVPRVLIFGDSITIEAKGSGDYESILRGYSVDWSATRFMTAPCNGIAIAKKITYVPDVVIINYSGNNASFTENCMAGEHDQALADRYRQDVQTLIDRYRNGRTKVVIVGAPTRKPHMAESNLIFTTLKALAAEPTNQVGFYDGGRLITPDRNLTTRAATCLSPRETGSHCGTSLDPTKNYIRDVYHDHLCPTGGTIGGTCNMYSSGAVRLSLNFRDGIKVAKVAVR